MSTYNYAPGAVHLDFHHNNISMSTSTITDLVRSFISGQAENIEDITPCDLSSNSPESDSGNPASSPVSDNRPKDEPLFKYIHYSITSESERLDIHRQICNIVRLPKMQLVCDALLVLMKSQKILTTIDQSAMLTELRRLGLPSATTPGFSDQNFFSYYRTK